MVLLFTNKEDAHPNLVLDILTEKGVPFFRLNTEALLTDYEFCWWAESAGCDFRITNIKTGLTMTGSEVTAVWDRRPEPPRYLPIDNTEEVNNHILKEALGFLRFLRYYLEDIPSVGSIVGDRVASSKMLQYRVAIDSGFIVPRTFFSNRKKDFLALCEKQKVLCIKGIEGSGVWDGKNGQEYVFFTRKVASQDLDAIPDDAFNQTVSFVQSYIEKAFELRITVIGNEVFATSIESQNLPCGRGKEDWRQGYDEGLRFVPYDLPEAIRQKCLTLVHALGLNFGCIDLVVRPDGEYVFLECNPNGQWLWIELTTGQKISTAIADFLINPSN